MERVQQVREGIGRWRPDVEVAEIRPLAGGMSAEMYVAGFAPLAGGGKVVARFPGDYMKTLFPDPATHEFQVLESVSELGLLAPRPLALCGEGDDKFLLIEFLEGRATARTSDPSGYIRELATHLARIHAAPVSEPLGALLPHTKAVFRARHETLNEDLREPEIVEALLALGEQPVHPQVLRHGDFWPGNILWQDGRIVGIVDWENALIGPAIADLAVSRLDVFWSFGREAMEEFTALYREANPDVCGNQAYWDLRIATGPMPNLPEWAVPYAALARPDIDAGHMRSVLMEFVDQGLRAL